MRNFVGIDLGTTNSTITTYDGKDTHIWKSPEQNDVTPSAIYIDKRGNKLIGKRAYDQAPLNPNNAAILFKRFMGTSTKMEFANQSMTPEECSAEILKVLYGYLPEEIRNDPNTGTIITVPAAFNQMQKDATMQAAQMAGIGNVSLMQEPVAAVMSIMKKGIGDGGDGGKRQRQVHLFADCGAAPLPDGRDGGNARGGGAPFGVSVSAPSGHGDAGDEALSSAHGTGERIVLLGASGANPPRSGV